MSMVSRESQDGTHKCRQDQVFLNLYPPEKSEPGVRADGKTKHHNNYTQDHDRDGQAVLVRRVNEIADFIVRRSHGWHLKHDVQLRRRKLGKVDGRHVREGMVLSARCPVVWLPE